MKRIGPNASDGGTVPPRDPSAVAALTRSWVPTLGVCRSAARGVDYGTGDNPVYQVGRKSFVFFAILAPMPPTPQAGERYLDAERLGIEPVDRQTGQVGQSRPSETSSH